MSKVDSCVTIARQRPAVLVVDDEVHVRSSIARLLHLHGYDVFQAATANDALGIIDSTPLDALLSDIRMPGLSGVELLRQAHSHDPDLPVVLMTGAPEIDSAAQAVELRAARYLLKPFEPNELRRVLHEVVQRGAEARLARARLERLADEEETERRRTDEVTRSFVRALGSIHMHFQPICSLETLRVFAHEALLRNTDPAFASPPTMLAAARAAQRELWLGQHVRGACARALDNAPDHLLFVNVDAGDLSDPELLSPASPLSAHAHRVVLEITERATILDAEGIVDHVRTLRDLGYRIAVDDLGAGYAGLSSFALLEPDFVKLDKSIIRGAQDSALKRKLIQSLTSLCREIRIQVIAEGIETHDELDVVRNAGCHLAQGYLFAKPAPAFRPLSWTSLDPTSGS